jgi:hypothetical protein
MSGQPQASADWPAGQGGKIWRFPDRARAEIERLGAGAAIKELEGEIAGYLLRDELAKVQAAIAEAYAIPRDHAALERIGRLASALASELETLAGSSTGRALGGELAHRQQGGGAGALHKAPIGHYRRMAFELGPAALAAHLAAVQELAAAANAAHGPRVPARRGRTPSAREQLLFNIFTALDYALAEGWREAWAPLTAPKGPLVRLVALCFEAIGEPVTTNLAQVVRRALRSHEAWLAILYGQQQRG